MTETDRIDEVEALYKPAKVAEVALLILFWLIVFVSFSQLFLKDLTDWFPSLTRDFLQISYFVLVMAYFLASLSSRYFLVPRAESARRKQLLSNAFAVAVSTKKTEHYYNNELTPSVDRLGANTMENALFSKSISEDMLVRTRLTYSLYLLIWLAVMFSVEAKPDVKTALTQLIFSGEIIAKWIGLELFRSKTERVYDDLYRHFLAGERSNENKNVAVILDSFATYENAKAAAGCLLSSKVFTRLNPSLTAKWKQIREQLVME